MPGTKIEYSADYEKFVSVKGNRGRIIGNDEFLKIQLSLLEYGWLIPITVAEDKKNNKLMVLEGQNRLFCAAGLGMPIAYYKVNIDTKKIIDVIGMINSTGKSFTREDWFIIHLMNGNKTFKYLKSVQDKYGFCFNEFFNIANNIVRMDDKTTYFIKTGAFIYSDEQKERLNKIINQIIDIYNFYPEYKKITNKSKLNRSLTVMMKHPQYDHSRFMSQLGKDVMRLRKSNTENGYKKMLTSIYNADKKEGGKNYVSLFKVIN